MIGLTQPQTIRQAVLKKAQPFLTPMSTHLSEFQSALNGIIQEK